MTMQRLSHGEAIDTEQVELPLTPVRPSVSSGAAMQVLDLFAGIGGLSIGFGEQEFSVTGIDSEESAGAVYSSAGIGKAITADLSVCSIYTQAAVVIGGPPCRPWSPVNLQKRGTQHDDHGLLTRFIEHVLGLRPAVFIMENVPALRGDESYKESLRLLRKAGYDVDAHILHYERFGAATTRRRLFTAGVRDTGSGAQQFFRLLKRQYQPAQSVREAIWRFRDLPREGFPDHDWSDLKSIGNYRERYASGQYGWRRLEYDAPAPSFGSVAKTYILHPDAGLNGYPERVLSVREVMAIMGFPDTLRFAEGTARARRYQMIANAVSPQVSRAVAAAVRQVLCPS
jgi:DNA (cytosine-5)-methyltransferase 1